MYCDNYPCRFSPDRLVIRCEQKRAIEPIHHARSAKMRVYNRQSSFPILHLHPIPTSVITKKPPENTAPPHLLANVQTRTTQIMKYTHASSTAVRRVDGERELHIVARSSAWAKGCTSTMHNRKGGCAGCCAGARWSRRSDRVSGMQTGVT